MGGFFVAILMIFLSETRACALVNIKILETNGLQTRHFSHPEENLGAIDKVLSLAQPCQPMPGDMPRGSGMPPSPRTSSVFLDSL